MADGVWHMVGMTKRQSCPDGDDGKYRFAYQP